MTNRIFIFLLVLSLTTVSKGQSIIRSTIGAFGGSAHGDVGFIQHSAGQPSAIRFMEFANGSAIRQGFNQPHFVVKGPQVDLEVLLYPNPNHGVFSFQLLNSDRKHYEYQISDPLGRLFQSGKGLGEDIIQVELNPNHAGVYFLTVHLDQSFFSFKILVTD